MCVLMHDEGKKRKAEEKKARYTEIQIEKESEQKTHSS